MMLYINSFLKHYMYKHHHAHGLDAQPWLFALQRPARTAAQLATAHCS